MWFDLLLDTPQKYMHLKILKIYPKQLVQNWWGNLGNAQASLDQICNRFHTKIQYVLDAPLNQVQLGPIWNNQQSN
jgi:hypothetical protein